MKQITVEEAQLLINKTDMPYTTIEGNYLICSVRDGIIKVDLTSWPILFEQSAPKGEL